MDTERPAERARRGMTPQDLIYAAALIDTLAVLKTRLVNGSDLPVIAMTTTRHVPAARFLGALTATRLTPLVKDYTHRGCNQHCPDKHNHVLSEGVRWQVTGAKATIVLHNVLPALRVQAGEAQRLVSLGRQIGYKGQVVNRMRELGWEIPDLRPQPRARVSLVAS